MSTPVFIIAQQRSGTNLLRRSLATTGLFRDSDEVFDPRREGFWPYYLNQVGQRPELLCPTSDNQIELFERFLDSHLDNDSPFTLLDVKYNSTHLQDGMWHSPVARSALINWLIRKQYPVIHLVRDNCLENYVSFLVGTHTQDWVVGASAKPPKPVKLELDAHHAVFQVKRRQRQIDRFRNDMVNARSIELRYESLIEPAGHFSNSVATKICEFLSIDETLSIDVQTKKTGRPLRDVVVNFDKEVVPLMIANGLGQYVPHEECVEDSPEANINSKPESLQVSDGSVEKIRPFHSLKFVTRENLPALRSKPVFVISIQQSGSRSLCDGLSKSGHFANFGEPFDPSTNGYWDFRQKMLAERPELALKTPANQLNVFETFLSDSLGDEKPIALIDVKYNSTQHLNEAWYHRGKRPLLLDWLVEKKHPVIHLVRDNVLGSYFGNWARQKSPDEPIYMNPNHLLQHLRFHQTQIDVFRQWLDPINFVEVNYEGLARSDTDSTGVEIEKIRNHLLLSVDIDVSFEGYPPLSFLAGKIQNFESEIIPALNENGYRKWVDQSWIDFDKDNSVIADCQAA